MQNLEVVASKLAKLWLFSLQLDTHLLKCYTQAVWLGRLDTSVIYQLPCPVSPELSTKQIGQSEGSNWYTPFKVLYSSSIAFCRLDTSVIYQLPCQGSPELRTKLIGQSEGSNWYTPFKVLYWSSVAWSFRQLPSDLSNL